ncbi:hypothetical protein Tco_1327177 [Tanacetum coccineum]
MYVNQLITTLVDIRVLDAETEVVDSEIQVMYEVVDDPEDAKENLVAVQVDIRVLDAEIKVVDSEIQVMYEVVDDPEDA